MDVHAVSLAMVDWARHFETTLAGRAIGALDAYAAERVVRDVAVALDESASTSQRRARLFDARRGLEQFRLSMQLATAHDRDGRARLTEGLEFIDDLVQVLADTADEISPRTRGPLVAEDTDSNSSYADEVEAVSMVDDTATSSRFGGLTDDQLLRIAADDALEPDDLRLLIQEIGERDLLTTEEVDHLLERFVQDSLQALYGQFMRLFRTHWGLGPLRDTARAEFVAAAEQYTEWLRQADDDGADISEDGEVTDDPGLSWPWPITEPPESAHGAGPQFDNKYSGLFLCGYHVGKQSPLSGPERRRLLDAFFRHRLPSVVAKYHGDAYGDPGSETRLRKMANVIAANCRNRKLAGREVYATAISDWEDDLEYLKRAYYHAGSFPWPPCEP